MEDDSGDDEIAKVLTCLICRQFFRTPKMLPKCGHSLCFECAVKSMRVGDNVLTCPKCRVASVLGPSGPQGLKTNAQLQRMVEAFESDLALKKEEELRGLNEQREKQLQKQISAIERSRSEAKKEAFRVCKRLDEILEAVVAEKKNRLIRMIDAFYDKKLEGGDKISVEKLVKIDESKLIPNELVQQLVNVAMHDVFEWREVDVDGENGFEEKSVESISDCFEKMHAAALNGDEAFFRRLFFRCKGMTRDERKRLVERFDPEMDRSTVLHKAALGGSVAVVKCLVEQFHANVESRQHDDQQSTALHLAALRGHLSVVRYLVTAMGPEGCLVKDKLGSTPLHNAVFRGHVDIVELFVNGAAKLLVNVENNLARTPVHVAAIANRKQIIEILATNGANLEAVDVSGKTALHLASSHGSLDAARALLTLCPQLHDIHDKKGFTALDCARYKQYSDIISLLLEHVGNKNNECLFQDK